MSETLPPSFIPHSDNTMQHASDDGDALDELLDGVSFEQGGESLPPADEANEYDSFLTSEQPELNEPDPSLLEPRKRTPTAKRYERKVSGLFSIGVKVTATQPHLLADSAALLMYGPDIAEKAGDLAAHDARVARAIDMLTDQTENPATALILASAPLVLQIIRNHEPVVESEKAPRTFKVPFTKRRLRFKLGFKLGKRMRNLTTEPETLKVHVFTNPKVQEALAKQGIIVSNG